MEKKSNRRRNPYARIVRQPLFKLRVILDKKKHLNKYQTRQKNIED